MNQTTLNKKLTAKPFMKWAGGKSQLLGQFQKYYPKELKTGQIKKYFEPFLGGGAVFLDVAQKFSIESAFLSDINEELILAYKVIQRKPESLIEFLWKYSMQYNNLSEEERKEYFYEVRTNLNLQRFQINYRRYSENWIPRAAQLIFLNKTCFNGLFRLNKKGEFNVPFGRYKNPDDTFFKDLLDGFNVYEINANRINIGIE